MIDKISERRIEIPVAIVLGQRTVKGSFWESRVWSLESVLLGASLANQQASGVLLHTAMTEPRPINLSENSSDTVLGKSASAQASVDSPVSHWLWSGFHVTLHRDACERYWHALVGEEPKIYVVMKGDEADDDVEPAIVTIDYDEATAHCEIDADVLTAAIPAELYQLMERYVIEHYKPVEFKKRKRKNWSEQDKAGSSSPEDAQIAQDPWDERRRFFRSGYHQR